MSREQRLVFGEVAEDYARERPSYPGALVDDVVALAGGRDALEVGAGTGKATAAFVARGLRVTALEPSPAMAAVGRRLVPAAEWVVSGIEEFDCDRRFDLVYAAQSWHWVDPARGFARVAELLRPGGLLALFWNRASDASGELRRALDAIYERLAPELAGGSSGGGAAHAAAIGTSGLFGPVEERTYRWSDRRSAASYVRLLGTHSNHRMLPEARRRALQDAVAGAIEAHGGDDRDLVRDRAVSRAAACRGGRTACWVGGEVGSGRGAVVPNDRYTAIWDRFPTQQPFAEPA